MANPKGNPKNLAKPGDPKHHKLTHEDQLKGAEAMRKKCQLARLLEEFGSYKPDSDKIIARMKKFGVPEKMQTNEAAIAAAITVGARAGNPQMIDRYMEGTGQKIQRNVNENHNIEYKPLVDLTKRKKNNED